VSTNTVLDGELVVGEARATVLRAFQDLVVNLLAGVQQKVFRKYLQPGCAGCPRNL
jgi:hypothetical protein